jgi:hypothetical protein
MHDVHRDSLIHKKKTRKKKKQHDPVEHSHSHDDHGHDHEANSHDHDDHNHEEHGHDHDDLHEHDHKEHSHDHDDPHEHDHEEYGHDHNDHDLPLGHEHEHDEEEYDGHDEDLHTHKHHDHEAFGDRDLGDPAFAHLHEHEHTFYHRHHHNHDPEHTGLVHKIFKDPVRDWFGAVLMLILIYAGYNRLLPGNLSDGMLVCAAIIGIFPVIKNALLECISRRRISIELIIGAVLLTGLFTGRFLEVAIAALLMLVGSFIRINFSWRS